MTAGLVYFAHPIDLVSNDEISLIARVSALASEAGLNLYRPASAYDVSVRTPETRSAIDRVNQAALRNCDALLAVLPSEMPTLGTPIEIERAASAGMPVLVISDSWQILQSVQVQGWINAGVVVLPIEHGPTQADLKKLLSSGPPKNALLVQRRTHDAMLPSRAYPDDAGLDLAASQEVAIPVGQSRNVPTGIRVAIPLGSWGMIIGRSSTWHRHGLLTIPGVIDAGWRGELFVAVHNLTGRFVQVAPGTRLGQLIVLPAWSGDLVEVVSLPAHARGTQGFGSTG